MAEAALKWVGKGVSIGTLVAVIAMAFTGFGAYREHDRAITDHEARIKAAEKLADRIDEKLDRVLEQKKRAEASPKQADPETQVFGFGSN